MTVQNNNQVIVDPGVPIFFGADQDERILLAGTAAVAAAGGDDTILGAPASGDAASIFFGNKGQDYVISRGIGDTVRAGQDNDKVLVEFGQADLYGDRDNDSLVGKQGRNTVRGGQGDDTLRVEGRSNLLLGDDILDPDAEGGDDYIVGDPTRDGGDDTQVGGQGNDSLFSSVNGNSFLFGNEGDDYVFSQANRQVFREEDNRDDTIVFEVFPDSLLGGKGNDYLLVGSNSDVPRPIMTGDLGGDTIGVLGTEVNRAILGGDINPAGGQNDPGTDAGDDYLFVNGGDGHELAGNIGNDTFSLGALAAGSDISVRGGQGDDIIVGSTAANGRFFGDAGNDYLRVSGSGAQFWGDNSSLSGSDLGNDTIIAIGTSNILQGDNPNAGTDGGNDYLDASLSSQDTLIGGGGNDTYIYDEGDYIVPDTLGDNVYIAAQVGSLENVLVQPNDQISGTGQFTIAGDENNTASIAEGGIITGGGQDNLTVGNVTGTTDSGGGNDRITAGAVSSSGSVSGGAGDDSINVTGTSTGFVGGADGNDTINYSGTSFIEGTTTGGAGDDVINVAGELRGFVDGEAGNDAIDLNTVASNATVQGGEGDDTITADSVQRGATFDGEGGNDRIIISGISTGVGTTPVDILGGAGDDRIGLTTQNPSLGTNPVSLDLDGEAGNDVLQGGAFKDDLNGGAGNDVLYGGKANLTTTEYNGLSSPVGSNNLGSLADFADGESLVGGAGNDTFVFTSDAEIGKGLQSFLGSSSYGSGNTVDIQLGSNDIEGGIPDNFLIGTGGQFLTADAITDDGTFYASGAIGVDTITDFTVGEDLIRLDVDNSTFDSSNQIPFNGSVQVFSGAGALFGAIVDGSSSADTFDPSQGSNVFANEGAFYETFALGGTTGIGAVDFDEAGGVFYDQNTGGLYLGDGDQANLIAVLGNKPDLSDTLISNVLSIGAVNLDSGNLNLF